MEKGGSRITMNKVINQLHEANVGKILLDEPMKKHTNWEIGGPADILIIPNSIAQLSKAIETLKAEGTPWMVIGRGSNLLVLDKGIRGAVIKLGEGFDTMRVEEDSIIVGAGYSFIKLAVQTAKMGLAGLEFASGIPGTVGGAVYMNAGAHGSDVSQVLKSAVVLWESGEIEELQLDELQFSYRTSVLQRRKGIVLEATFVLKKGDRQEITKCMNAYKERRLETQPYTEACAGSVFRNPVGDHAGRLIESLGLKGKQIGGAQISPIHSNFIVNRGSARASDVLDLIQFVQREVKVHYDVELETEVLVMGEE